MRARSLFSKIMDELRPYWGSMGLLVLLDLLAIPLALLIPVPLKIAVDSVIGTEELPGFLHPLIPDFAMSSDFRLLVVAAVLQVAVLLLVQVQALISYVAHTRVGERITLDFRGRLFRHVQGLSLSFHDSRGTADSVYRIQEDARALQYILDLGLPFVSSLLLVASAIYVTMRLDPQLAWAAIVVLPFLVVFSRTYDRRFRGRYVDQKELETSALKVVQEALSSVRVVKAFGREDQEHERFLRRSGDSVRALVRLSFAEGAFGLFVNLTTAIGAAVVLFLGVLHVQSDILSIGELYLVMQYLAQLYGPLQESSQSVAGLQSSLASAQRVFDVLDEGAEAVDRPGARPLRRAFGTIEFRKVTFAYDDENRVLHDVSFRIEGGMRLGIQGATGAGKTTLVSLLTRFYDPTSGEILLDGIDLRDYKIADLRNQLGIVLQEPVLFSSSIAENIAYARSHSDHDQMVSAAKAANAHDFILRLPQGYDTIVGERGMKLSGGERQRIALARAFLKDAPILILDEPTSSVDEKTETAIMEAMTRLMSGRTTLMIAHRLSTLDVCDARIELEHGRIVRSDGNCRVA